MASDSVDISLGAAMRRVLNAAAFGVSLLAAVALLGGALYWSGALSAHPAVLASLLVTAYLWRDIVSCVAGLKGLARWIMVCKLVMLGVTIITWLVAVSDLNNPWATSMTLVVSGLVYRFACGRLGTLATLETIDWCAGRRTS